MMMKSVLSVVFALAIATSAQAQSYQGTLTGGGTDYPNYDLIQLYFTAVGPAAPIWIDHLQTILVPFEDQVIEVEIWVTIHSDWCPDPGTWVVKALPNRALHEFRLRTATEVLAEETVIPQ